MAFRGNFVVKVFVELLWLAILLLFNFTLFEYTRTSPTGISTSTSSSSAATSRWPGCFEMLFLSNCNEFAELVRTGDLDFFLLSRSTRQFMVSCRNVRLVVRSQRPAWRRRDGVRPVGRGVAGPLVRHTRSFLAMFVCGVALAYGFLLMLTAASVWFIAQPEPDGDVVAVRTLMRYPREIFLRTAWVSPIGSSSRRSSRSCW